MKVVIDDKIPFIKGVLEKYAEVVYLDGSHISRKDVMDADALIIRTRTKCNAKLLDGTKVKFIATATIGFDHIDTEYCSSKNISWTNAAGCNSSSVQQYFAAALIYLVEKYKLSMDDLTIGIVGVGNVGKKVASLCEALGMKVLLNDPPRERVENFETFVSLDRIVSESDIITFHVPLNYEGRDKTYHLVGDEFLSKLNENQFIINTSRGEVVKTESLKQVLRKQKIKGCILDVWENEPEIDSELLEMVDIGTPHIAGYSSEGKANGTAMSVNSFCSHFGFNLKNWYPENIPAPPVTIIDVDCEEFNIQEILGKLIRSTYNILEDDSKLRASPGTFEKQRGEYPVRREFSAYKVNVSSVNTKIENIIRKIGFNLLVNI
ncbi:MAG: 4-phosphoerythronate dehydrogenase PdxB [Ignavibacteriales bacterium]|nr:4-phosphoerythronate dehydrogenase PdxB [Ignavibacteriales bacterium]